MVLRGVCFEAEGVHAFEGVAVHGGLTDTEGGDRVVSVGYGMTRKLINLRRSTSSPFSPSLHLRILIILIMNQLTLLILNHLRLLTLSTHHPLLFSNHSNLRIQQRVSFSNQSLRQLYSLLPVPERFMMLVDLAEYRTDL